VISPTLKNTYTHTILPILDLEILGRNKDKSQSKNIKLKKELFKDVVSQEIFE